MGEERREGGGEGGKGKTRHDVAGEIKGRTRRGQEMV